MSYSVYNFDNLPKDLDSDLVETVDKIAKVACHLSYLISIGSLSSISLNKKTSTNSDGDEQKALDVYADESPNESFMANDHELIVKTQESYDNLCIKTYEMIKSCLSFFDFDILIKLDASIINDKHVSVSSVFSFNNFRSKGLSDRLMTQTNS